MPTIQLRRGPDTNLAGATAADGEPLWTTDTHVLYVSQGGVKYAVGGPGVTTPLTTRGDLYAYSTGPTRQPVGGTNFVLQADASQATGLRWGLAYTAANGETVLAVGFTMTAANGTFQDSGLTVTLPTPGRYLLTFTVRAQAVVTVGAPGRVLGRVAAVSGGSLLPGSEVLLLRLPATAAVEESTTTLTATVLTGAVNEQYRLEVCRKDATTWGTSQLVSDVDGRTKAHYVFLAPVATLLSDTYSGAGSTALTAHTMDLGSGWSVGGAGTWTVTSSQLQFTCTPPAAGVAWAEAGTGADATMAATVVLPTGTAEAGLVGRLGDASNYWLLSLSSTNTLALYEVVAGVKTSRASASFTVTPGTPYAFSLQFRGTSVVGVVNTTGVNYTSGSFAGNTRYGTYVNQGGTTGAPPNFDNFIVTSP